MTSKEHPTATITTPNSTPGQSGRFGSERVAAFRRNQWPLSSECAGAIRTGSGRQAARMAPFKWVNTTLGNIKSAITGTYPKLGPDHAQRYLASFAWRYNRRYQLNTMIPRFVHSAARTQPTPYRTLIAG